MQDKKGIETYVCIVRFDHPRTAQALVDFLIVKGMKATTIEEEGEHCVCVDEADQSEASQHVAHFLENPNHPKYWQASWQRNDTAKGAIAMVNQKQNKSESFKPFSIALALVCVLVFFSPLVVHGSWMSILAFPDEWSLLQHGQWWRLFTPVLMHGGFLHIGFNLVLWLVYASFIEAKQGAFKLAVMTLVIAVASNVMQFAWSYSANFAGLSGVVFGVIAYQWMLGRQNKAHLNAQSLKVFPGLLVYQALCFTPLIPLAFGAQIANGAHLGGLAAGIIWGQIDAVRFRARQGRERETS